MFLARVTGSVVATQKVASLTGHKLLAVEPMRVDPDQRDRLVGTGRTFVCVDTVGAGQGEMVLIVQGSSARLTPETEKLPVDATIIGIVDTVHIHNQTIFDAKA
ncbi:MAG: EutN/CcmL family microcompartment protein [Gemmataceae bacterium]|nr:EutN/CcmL family microcompartment protein [Gemmataceae bacterium]